MMLLSISTGCSENLSMSTHHFRASNKVAQRVLQHDTNEFPFPNIKYLESASKPSEMPFKSRQTPAGSGQGIIRDISRQGKCKSIYINAL